MSKLLNLKAYITDFERIAACIPTDELFAKSLVTGYLMGTVKDEAFEEHHKKLLSECREICRDAIEEIKEDVDDNTVTEDELDMAIKWAEDVKDRLLEKLKEASHEFSKYTLLSKFALFSPLMKDSMRRYRDDHPEDLDGNEDIFNKLRDSVCQKTNEIYKRIEHNLENMAPFRIDIINKICTYYALNPDTDLSFLQVEALAKK